MNQKDIDDAIEWERKKNERIKQNRKRYIELMKQLHKNYRAKFPDPLPYDTDFNAKEELRFFNDTQVSEQDTIENELILELLKSIKKPTRYEQKQ